MISCCAVGSPFRQWWSCFNLQSDAISTFSQNYGSQPSLKLKEQTLEPRAVEEEGEQEVAMTGQQEPCIDSPAVAQVELGSPLLKLEKHVRSRRTCLAAPLSAQVPRLWEHLAKLNESKNHQGAAS